MSILPSFMAGKETKGKKTAAAYPPLREYGIDYDTGFLTGKLVEGKEAIKVWIWMCLQIERFRFPIYSWAYGTEFEQYIGKRITDEFLQTDCRAAVEEALLIHPMIDGISDFAAAIEKERLSISFKANTKLGEVEIYV